MHYITDSSNPPQKKVSNKLIYIHTQPKTSS